MVLIPRRDPPFQSAKLSKHLEYRRWKDREHLRSMIDGWCFAAILFGGMGLAFAVVLAGILDKL